MKVFVWALLLVTAAPGHSFAQKKKSITIIASYNGLQENDSLQLFYGTKGTIHYEHFEYQAIGTRIGKNTFRFEVPAPAAIGRIAICRTWFEEKATDIVFWGFSAEPGDEVRIDADTGRDTRAKNTRLSFSGKHALKYRVQYESDTMITHGNYEQDLKDALERIDQHKSTLSPLLYQTIRIQAFSRGLLRGEEVRASMFSRGRSVGSMYDNLPPAIQQIENMPSAMLAASPDFVNYYLSKLRNNNIALNFDTVTKWEPAIDFPVLLDTIATIKAAELKENLVMEFIQRYADRYKDEDRLVAKALKLVKDPGNMALLEKYNRRTIGEPFFNFSLTDKEGRQWQLKDFAGKIIYIDCWYTGCPWCADHYQRVLKPLKEQLKKDTSIVFLSVCVDPTRKQWQESVAGGKYTDPEGWNLYTNEEAQKHPLLLYYNIQGYPCNILIGKDGRIVRFDGKSLRIKESILEQLNNLK